jgi:hypothetical protein
MIGVTTCSKRVFSRRQYEKKEVTASLQDGNREWITVVATICADGTALPPGLIFMSKNSTMQASWVADIEAGKHQVHVSSTPSGWTNDEAALSWVEQVFNRYTKAKARQGRDWRLLILDGHGSHLTQPFFDYCESQRILLAQFPPHSTHTLQPLDVVMFKPLSTSYSSALVDYLHQSQGLLPVKKGDFFLLFWSAWSTVFTRKELILKAFESTGIWPKNRQAVLKRFQKQAPNESEASRTTPNKWIELERLLRSVVDDTASDRARQLSEKLHHYQVDNELLHMENQGLRNAVTTKKKHKKKGRVLDLQQHEEYWGGAVFWSPRAIREARVRESVRDDEEKRLQLQKADAKKLREQNKLLNMKLKEESRVAAEQRKVEREEKKAKAEAECARKAEARNNKQAIQTTQIGKRKASQSSKPKAKRVQRSGNNGAGAVGGEPSHDAPVRRSTSGRTIKSTAKYR